VIWQLNEIWPTGGWGSVEYGTPVEGQVIGGRWKPFHHWLSSFLYRSLFSSCSADNAPECVIKNNSPFRAEGTLYISLLRFSDGKKTPVKVDSFSMPGGVAESVWTCAMSNHDGSCATWPTILAFGGCASMSDCLLLLDIKTSDTTISNFIPLTTPQQMKLPKVTITLSVDSVSGAVTLKSDATAVFVTLTTQAQGRFGENTFWMTAGTKTVDFVWFGKMDIPTLQSTLRVEHAQMYM
jgi:hypothetical protein